MKDQVIYIDNDSVTFHKYGKISTYNHSLEKKLDEFYLLESPRRL